MMKKIGRLVMAEIRHDVGLYFAPLVAAWQVLRHGGRYGFRLRCLYRRNGLL